MVDGILLMSVSDEKDHVVEIKNSGIPIVLIDRLINNIDIDAVVVDNATGSYEAVKSLLDKGHKNIGIIAGPDSIYTARERLIGYKKALTDTNIDISPQYISTTNYQKDGGYLGFKLGYDQLEFFEIFNPPISVVSQPRDEIGTNAQSYY